MCRGGVVGCRRWELIVLFRLVAMRWRGVYWLWLLVYDGLLDWVCLSG